MSAHTPTPWVLRPAADLSGDVGILTHEADGCIAECFAKIRRRDERAEDEALANAALIVRAVNAHEYLVAALRELRGDATFDPEWSDLSRSEHESMLDRASAALERAGAA